MKVPAAVAAFAWRTPGFAVTLAAVVVGAAPFLRALSVAIGFGVHDRRHDA
ncbi:MAG TPA: hypothetical protein VIY28_09240 [Pseudonocardiaceae bacterium]